MTPTTRIGIGYDVHAFAEGRPLVLGGVELPHGQGLAGHSDADVLAHALMDALLGAMRAEDIGAHFPDNDPKWRDVSSMLLLQYIAEVMAERGFRLLDADCVLVLERPKVAPYRDEMRARMAAALGVSVDAIGLKATTTEGLGFAGRGEGVAAQAVVLLETSG
jgi:2-C-methyl-D-erythritol 2,4-cyclodiphosphate synthase